ncbi:hypothetical protein CPB85DRAFT_1439517 [Mucidula mucida]|nr:hypothetical protein CPB85DRAFT_1439517 [Mucidula mucida]
MLYRFVSLILISALSVGAIAADSCSAVAKDCDDLATRVNVVEAAMQEYATSHSQLDALVCHVGTQSLIQGLNNVAKDAQARTFTCVPTASGATALCDKLTGIAPRIIALFKTIDQVAPVFKAKGGGGVLCSDMKSIEDSYKQDVAVFFKKVSAFTQCSAASKLVVEVAADLNSTKNVCCAA